MGSQTRLLKVANLTIVYGKAIKPAQLGTPVHLKNMVRIQDFHRLMECLGTVPNIGLPAPSDFSDMLTIIFNESEDGILAAMTGIGYEFIRAIIELL